MEQFAWLIVALAMAVVEAASAGLVTAWFVVGALAAFAVQLAGGPVLVQTIVFIVVSVACLVLLRPMVMRMRAQGAAAESTPVGLQAVVVEPVDNASHTGRVETPDHMTWAAVSADGSPLPVGQSVRVVDQRSVKLIVERI